MKKKTNITPAQQLAISKLALRALVAIEREFDGDDLSDEVYARVLIEAVSTVMEELGPSKKSASKTLS